MAIRKLTFTQLGDEELLEMSDLVRLTKQGETTIRKAVREGTFPLPKRLPTGSPRWTMGQFRAWLRSLEDYELTDTREQMEASAVSLMPAGKEAA